MHGPFGHVFEGYVTLMNLILKLSGGFANTKRRKREKCINICINGIKYIYKALKIQSTINSNQCPLLKADSGPENYFKENPRNVNLLLYTF
jgi:hypothetical protein